MIMSAVDLERKFQNHERLPERSDDGMAAGPGGVIYLTSDDEDSIAAVYPSQTKKSSVIDRALKIKQPRTSFSHSGPSSLLEEFDHLTGFFLFCFQSVF
jgi:hypothetical protein